MKKILILASNPRRDLNLDREIRDLKDVVESSRNRDLFEVEDALAVRCEDLQELLLQHQPDIVHFCGHGGGKSGLVLEDSQGHERWVQTDALRDLFRLFSSKVRCVLLNACYSEEQAGEIVNHVDYVIGMDQAIRDDAAIAFSKGFYRALGYGCSIEEAYEFGCNAIQLEITSHSTVRSGTTALVRKAEVVNTVATTIIPEHVKPILKKRAGTLRSNHWESDAKRSISPKRKEEILEELAQDLVTPPQGLLSTPMPQRRGIPLLLVGSIFVGLLPVLGIFGYLKWLKSPSAQPVSVSTNQIEPQTRTALPPIVPSDSRPEQLLKKAQEFATQRQWREAIAYLEAIPSSSPLAGEAKDYLLSWSEPILKSAQEDYEIGELDKALEKVGKIPENSSYHEQAKDAIVAWSKEKQNSDKITEALKVLDIQTPRQLITTIKSPGLQKQLEQKIQNSEAEVLTKAQGFHDSGNLDKALELAKKIAESSPLYPEAQGMIAGWNEKTDPGNGTEPGSGTDLDYGWLSDRLVTDADLTGKSALELDVLRNLLFAKYGLRFKDPELQKEFESQPWYQPTDISAEAVYEKLSAQERQNVQLICTFQKERNLSRNKNLSCG
jgi:tetratricopeptide (TPR) repeat protein